MSDEVPEFICHHWDPVLSIGRVAYVNCDRERARDGSDLMGKQVLIDGKRYTCKGVERITGDGPIRKGERIGILIEGEN